MVRAIQLRGGGAFDETDWPTNDALRKRCLEQLHVVLETEREALREELILESGGRALMHGPQLDAPLVDVFDAAKLIDEYAWVTDLGERARLPPGKRTAERSGANRSVVGAIVPWKFPFEARSQARRGARHRQHGGAEAGT